MDISNSCPSNPVILSRPNTYDYNRSDQGFAHPWLIENAPGGAIAYFGETGIAPDPMGGELETYVLAAYGSKINPVLGDIYLEAQRQYWAKHQNDSGTPISSPRFYLGWMVFFGDPSLRLPRILDPCQSLRLTVENLQEALSRGEVIPKDRPAAEAYLRDLISQLVACEKKFPKEQ